MGKEYEGIMYLIKTGVLGENGNQKGEDNLVRCLEYLDKKSPEKVPRASGPPECED